MASKPPRISSYLSFYLWQQRRRQQRRRQQQRQAEASAEAYVRVLERSHRARHGAHTLPCWSRARRHVVLRDNVVLTSSTTSSARFGLFLVGPRLFTANSHLCKRNSVLYCFRNPVRTTRLRNNAPLCSMGPRPLCSAVRARPSRAAPALSSVTAAARYRRWHR